MNFLWIMACGLAMASGILFATFEPASPLAFVCTGVAAICAYMWRTERDKS